MWLLTFEVLNHRDYELLQRMWTCGFAQSVYIKNTTPLLWGLELFILGMGEHWAPFEISYNCNLSRKHLSTDTAIINSLCHLGSREAPSFHQWMERQVSWVAWVPIVQHNAAWGTSNKVMPQKPETLACCTLGRTSLVSSYVWVILELLRLKGGWFCGYMQNPTPAC